MSKEQRVNASNKKKGQGYLFMNKSDQFDCEHVGW